jgi:hypothetical protein
MDARTLSVGVSVGIDAFADRDTVAQPLTPAVTEVETDGEGRFVVDTMAVPESGGVALRLAETLGDPDAALDSVSDALADGQPLWSGVLVAVKENTEADAEAVTDEETDDDGVLTGFVTVGVPESDDDAEWHKLAVLDTLDVSVINEVPVRDSVALPDGV